MSSYYELGGIRYAEDEPDRRYFGPGPCRSLKGLFAPDVPAELRGKLDPPKVMPAPPAEAPKAPVVCDTIHRANMPAEARAIASAARVREYAKPVERTDAYRAYQREYQRKRYAKEHPGSTSRVKIPKRDPVTCDHIYESKPCFRTDGFVHGKQRYECKSCETKAYLIDGVYMTAAMRKAAKIARAA
jgi:hypothetical protein